MRVPHCHRAQIILYYSDLCTHLPPLPGEGLAAQCPRTEPKAQYLAETPSWDKAEGHFLLSVPGRWQRPLLSPQVMGRSPGNMWFPSPSQKHPPTAYLHLKEG